MDNYVLYEHRNKTNGKRYIGITNNVSKRWYGEGKKYEKCPRFWNAIKKYGWDGFEHKILLTGLSIERANEAEQVYITKYKTCDKRYGYNIMPGGNFHQTMLGKHHTEETKAKMREKAVGRIIPEAQRQRHSEIMRGKMVGEKNNKSKAVRCITTGEIFVTQRAAAEAKGVSQAKICLCCQGKRTHTHGLRWEYVDKLEANT